MGQALFEKSYKKLSHGVNERVIRNDKELFNIRQYIINNPLKWELDNENPTNWEIAK